MNSLQNWIEYKFGSGSSIRLAKGSYQKQCFIIESPTVRRYLWLDMNSEGKKICRQLNTISLLQQNNIPVPEVIEQGSLVLKNKKIEYILFSDLNGYSLGLVQDNIPKKQLDQLMFKMGSVLGSIHSIKVADKYGYMDNVIHEKWDHVLEVNLYLWLNSLSKYVNSLDLYHIEDYFQNKLTKLPVNRPVLVHGDYYPNNIIVSKNNDEWEIKGVIDFEWSLIGQAEYDFRVMEQFIFSNSEMRLLFYDGYKGHVSLNAILTYVLLYRLELLAISTMQLQKNAKELTKEVHSLLRSMQNSTIEN